MDYEKNKEQIINDNLKSTNREMIEEFLNSPAYQEWLAEQKKRLWKSLRICYLCAKSWDLKKDIFYNSPLGKNNIRCERITFAECIRGSL